MIPSPLADHLNSSLIHGMMCLGDTVHVPLSTWSLPTLLETAPIDMFPYEILKWIFDCGEICKNQREPSKTTHGDRQQIPTQKADTC